MNRTIIRSLKLFAASAAVLIAGQGHAMGARSHEQVDRVIQQNQLVAGALFGEATSRDRTQYHLSLQEIPMRKGSFFGVIVQLGSKSNPKKEIIPAKVSAYVIDPISPSLYSLTPLTMGSTSIATWDDRPTLQLQISRERILVSPVEDPAGAQNSGLAGFRDTISFEWDSCFRLNSPVDGVYGRKTSRKKTQISMSGNGQSLDSSLDLDSFKLTGTFSARSYLDAISTLRGTKVSVYGTEEESRARALYVNLQVVDSRNRPVSDNVMVFTLENSGSGNGYLLPRIQ